MSSQFYSERRASRHPNAAWLEGREVIAVFEQRADPKPSYITWLEWRDGRISFIRDYRYARYIAADAELAPDAQPSGGNAAPGP